VAATKFDKDGQGGQERCMSRALRYAPGGMVFHVLSRGVGRRTLFDKEEGFLFPATRRHFMFQPFAILPKAECPLGLSLKTDN